MKNLLAILAFSVLTLISCQSEPKTTNSTETPRVAASVPTSTPAPAPAPVAPAPEVEMDMDKKAIADEAPAVPAEKVKASKSPKNVETPVEPTPVKVTTSTKVKEVITENKEEMEAKMAAEKKKIADEAAKAKAEAERIAAEKAAKVKVKATETVENPKNKIEEKIEKVKEIKEEMAFSHKAFDDLLRKYVSSTGKVNYSGFKKDQAKLKGYLKELEGQAVESGWSKNKKLAYWINAYNAYTIDLIVNNYPVKSITDLEGGKPWDKKFINLNGKTLSLNNIENDIIRPTFKDARIHFAVNCAAKSCPPLLNKAWTADNLQSELEKRTKAFINDSSYNTISTGSATISKIFEWYAVDFGNLNEYLAKYSKTPVNGSTKINYNEYDWSLNE
jgi:chemotaxis protein histidine kinase CheA